MKICSTFYFSLVMTMLLLPAMLNSQPAEVVYYPEPECIAKSNTVGIENAVKSKNSYYKQSNSEFMIFDSLANVYSYGNLMTNKAIKYEPQLGKLVTVKRGYHDPISNPSYSGSNSKNNLMLRISDDFGKTWEPEILIYNQQSNNLNEARYPSICPFVYESELTVASNVPRVIESSGVWPGHFFGFWNKSYTGINIGHANTVSGNTGLEWSASSRIIADAIGDDSFYHFAVSRIVASDELDVENANHIGWKRTLDLNEPIQQQIPSQWASSNFRTVSSGYRSNELVDLHKSSNGDFFLGVFGGFISIEEKNSFGISRSSDLGLNWTDFVIMPWSVANDFIISKGHPSDSANFYYLNKGFTVYELNNQPVCSFVAQITAWGTGTTKKYIIEIVYSYAMNEWKINEITSNITGSYILYQDIKNNNDQRTNWNDIELEVTKTVDGQHLLAKWVDLIDYNPDANTFTTTDIFVTAKNIQSNKWSLPVNITNSDDLDRMTMLPDMIPNSLTQIPIFKMITKTDPGATASEIFEEQFYGGKPQYLAVAHFDAIVGIKDDQDTCCNKKITIQKIKPNPNKGDIFSVEFNLKEENEVVIGIYDATGKLIDDLKEHNRFYTYGGHTLIIDLSNKQLPIGTFYLNMISGGEKQTEMFTVVR